MPTESPSRRFVVWSAAITATVAILVLAGWWFRIGPLVRLAPHYPPVRFNTALGLLGAAAGLWGIALGRRSMLILGGGVALVVGGASLVESIAGTSLGVDRLVIRDTAWIEVVSPVPPGMAAASGLILALIGAALVVLCLDRWNRLATMMAGTMGTIVIGLSVATLISQVTGVLSDSIRSGTGTNIGLHAALAFSLVGLAVVRYSWGQADLAALLPDWLPVAAGVALLGLAVILVLALSGGDDSTAAASAAQDPSPAIIVPPTLAGSGRATAAVPPDAPPATAVIEDAVLAAEPADASPAGVSGSGSGSAIEAGSGAGSGSAVKKKRRPKATWNPDELFLK